MEINELRAQIEKSSRRAGVLSMIGVTIVVAALIFSFYFLNRQYEKLQGLDTEIGKKEARNGELDRELLEKEQKLQNTQSTLVSVQDAIKDKNPEEANKVIAEVVKNNPKANQVLLEANVKSVPNGVPPPSGAKVAFCPENDVRIRDSSSLDSNVIGKLKKGQTIYVTGFSQNVSEWKGKTAPWASIQTEDGTKGWVLGVFVAYAPDRSASQTKNQ